MVQKLHRKPTTLTRCALMIAAPCQDWNVFKQIFAEHWDGFTHAHPRYQTSYYDALVAKMLDCGNPEKMGYLDSPSIGRLSLQKMSANAHVWGGWGMLSLRA